eukprot:jgi/Chrzof1/351/Cz01g12170.t1
MKDWLFGDEGHEPTKDNVIALAQEVVKTDFLLLTAEDLPKLDFESRKDAAQVFGAIVRIRDQSDRCPGAIYVQQKPQILDILFEGYDDPSIALNCGSMYRDCVRDETLAKLVLASPNFMDLFDKLEVPNFEVASDAFSSFKDLLTRHKGAVAQYLSDHYQKFFEAYSDLLKSPNYVTRRQSLKLLGELLLDRSNVNLMMRYVSDVKNLMQMMNLLKDTSRSIQFEAFHVFKVFVANPRKPQPIVDILTNNKDKLLKYLEDFHTDKDDDEQFKEEKAVIIKEISMMGREQQQQQPVAAARTASGGAAAAEPPSQQSIEENSAMSSVSSTWGSGDRCRAGQGRE